MGHKVFNNIDRGYEMFGRSITDWIIVLGVTLSMWGLVYNRIPVHDFVRLGLALPTGWIMLQAVTNYRDNYPPKLAQYIMDWITQGDNYIVTPDTKATPLSSDDELVALEEDRLAEQRELTALAREDRAQRRRDGREQMIELPGRGGEEPRRALPMSRVSRPDNQNQPAAQPTAQPSPRTRRNTKDDA